MIILKKNVLFLLLLLFCSQKKIFSFEKNIFDIATVYVDSNGTDNITNISKKNFDTNFKPFTEIIKSQTFTNYTYWIKFKITSATKQYIISKNIFIDKIVLYRPSANGWKEKKNGLLELNDRTGYSVLSILIPKNSEEKIVYLKIQSNCISMLDIWLIEDSKLQKQEMFKSIFYLIFIFIILGYFVVVLFLYFVSKQKGLLILAFYALVSILMIVFTNGYLYQWLPQLNLTFYRWSFVYIVDIYWATALLLSYYLFEVPKHSKNLSKIFYVSLLFLLIMLFSPLVLERQTVTKIHFIIPTLFILINTVSGFYLYFKKKVKAAIFLSIGWLVYFVLLFIWSIGKGGLIQKSFFTDNAPAFGLILEFLLFAIIGGLYYIKKQKENQNLLIRLNKIDKQKQEIEEKFIALFNALSKREKEVLELMATGLLDKEIADQLDLSLPSIRTYSKRIYEKLQVSNRTEAANIYNKLKIIQSI